MPDSPSTPLHTSTGVRALRELQNVCADFAARETALEHEIAERDKAIRRKFRDDTAATVSRLEAEEAELRALWQGVEERHEQRVLARDERIPISYRNALQALQRSARQKKEQHLSNLQVRHFQVERQQPLDQRALDTALAEWGKQLGEERVRLLSLVRTARKAVAGFPKARAALQNLEAETSVPEERTDRAYRMALLQQGLETGETKVEDFRRAVVPKVLGAWPALLGAAVLGTGVAVLLGHTPQERIFLGAVCLGIVAVCALALRVARGQIAHRALAVAEAVRGAHAAYNVCRAVSLAQHEQEQAALKERYAREFAEIEAEWARGEDVERRFAAARKKKLETQILRVMERQRRRAVYLRAFGQQTYAPRVEELHAQAEQKKLELAATREAELTSLQHEEEAKRNELRKNFHAATTPYFVMLQDLRRAAERTAVEWFDDVPRTWEPPEAFPTVLPFGELELDLAAGALPQHPSMALPGSTLVSVPLVLDFADEGSLLLETQNPDPDAELDALQAVLLRLFASVPAGKITVTIIDPVGLGKNFAGLMHLGDYEESLINRRIWTQRDQIEDRLAELNEHIEKVIQMYLRSDFPSIAAYNAQAGSVAEKLHFLVVANFPHGWSETALARLKSIAASGARCGVWALLHRDVRTSILEGVTSEDLRRVSVTLQETAGTLHLLGAPAAAAVKLAEPPPREYGAALVHRIGQRSVDSNRVEVPFGQISPAEGDFWQQETASELRIPIGRTGATKLQYLALGKGTRQHALLAGKTGSGKSTLLHVIITNLALTCSPQEVEFYLIDFKKGVEFKCYAQHLLPHARVVAIESDREFGLSVLRRVDEELRRRGDLFRKANVQDVPGYRRTPGAEPMPRTLLIIDEFQEFFVEDDALAQEASLLFDRIVRQGRAFGIHVLLGSQTLGGAYTLARSTLGQMVVRIALQSNEADAYLIMDENNAAPRLLSRPGEGIYNDAAGAVSGNSPFQVVWLPEGERDRLLQSVYDLAKRREISMPAPVIFEGNAPAEAGQNTLLAKTLGAPPAPATATPRAWLGAPNAIKGPTEVLFPRQSGAHLLIVGQRSETAASQLGLSLLALAAQCTAASKFLLITQAAPDSAEGEFFAQLAHAIPERLTLASGLNFGASLHAMAEELRTRQQSDDGGMGAPPLFVFIHELQRYKKLRQEDDFSFSSRPAEEGGNPADDLMEIINEGSSHGIYLLASIDTFTNVGRALSRKALAEFGQRVVFQMSANDSASLIESPAASSLGLHRAILYREQEGSLETFRPYAMPTTAWMDETLLWFGSRAKEMTPFPKRD